MPAILDGERELVTPLAVEQHTLYGIERALFGIRWADENGEGEREREAIKSAQIRYSTTPIGAAVAPTWMKMFRKGREKSW